MLWLSERSPQKIVWNLRFSLFGWKSRGYSADHFIPLTYTRFLFLQIQDSEQRNIMENRWLVDANFFSYRAHHAFHRMRPTNAMRHSTLPEY